MHAPLATNSYALEPGGESRVVLVETDGPRSGYRFADRIRAFRAAKREPLEGVAEEALILERAGERMIAMRHPRGAIYVNLSSRRCDEAQTKRVAEHVATRIALIEKLPARGSPQLPTSIRRLRARAGCTST